MKIILNKIEKVVTENSVRISCLVESENISPYTIWYEVQKDFEMYLCDDRADAFLVGLLPYFMAHSNVNDITEVFINSPISEKLYYQLVKYYIPTVASSTEMFNPIVIHPSSFVSNLSSSENCVGTGISGGVDSFYTAYKHLNTDMLQYNITHGVYYNTGMFGGFDGTGEQLLLNRAKSICKELNIIFLSISSNICTDIYKMLHAAIISPMFMSFILALQKLFRVYYHSSETPFSMFVIDEHNSESYDLLNVHCFSTESLTFYSAGGEINRIGKLKYLNNYELVKNELVVCPGNSVKSSRFNNCSKCAKCTYTMLGLDALGILNNFSHVFDVDLFYKNKNYYLGYIFFKGKKYMFIKEILLAYKNRGVFLGLIPRIYGICKIIKNGFRRSGHFAKSYRP